MATGSYPVASGIILSCLPGPLLCCPAVAIACETFQPRADYEVRELARILSWRSIEFRPKSLVSVKWSSG